jgi:hypothetical protein
LKRIGSLIGLLLALGPLAGAGGVRVAGPVVQLDPASVDFGTIAQGAIRTADVTVSNEGTAPLRILKVQSDCGCTVPSLSDSVLAPGETTRLHIELSTAGTSGEIAKTVMLKTNDPASPNAAVVLRALVRSPIHFGPTELNLGTLARGASWADTIRIKVARAEPLTIDSLSFPSDLVTTQTGEHADGDSLVYEVRVRLRPDVPPGPVHATGHIYTSHRLARDLSIRLVGQVIGAFRIDPVEFSFGQFRQGAVRQRTVRVTAVGGSHRVLGAACSDARLTAAVETIRDGEVYDVVLTLPADMPRGQLRADVRIETDDAQQRVITLPVIGLVRRKPAGKPE